MDRESKHPTQPAYDRILAHGFRAALVTYFVGWGGDGYRFLKPENAHQYGRFLGARYRGRRAWGSPRSSDRALRP